jgi:hypothetical protein
MNFILKFKIIKFKFKDYIFKNYIRNNIFYKIYYLEKIFNDEKFYLY